MVEHEIEVATIYMASSLVRRRSKQRLVFIAKRRKELMVDLGKRDCANVIEQHHSVATLSFDCLQLLGGVHVLAIKRGDDLGLNPTGGSIFSLVVSV